MTEPCLTNRNGILIDAKGRLWAPGTRVCTTFRGFLHAPVKSSWSVDWGDVWLVFKSWVLRRRVNLAVRVVDQVEMDVAVWTAGYTTIIASGDGEGTTWERDETLSKLRALVQEGADTPMADSGAYKAAAAFLAERR